MCKRFYRTHCYEKIKQKLMEIYIAHIYINKKSVKGSSKSIHTYTCLTTNVRAGHYTMLNDK